MKLSIGSKTSDRYCKSLAVVFMALLLAACSSVNRSVESGQNQVSYQPAGRQAVELSSPEGEKRLYESQARTDFLPLSMRFETQQNPAYCGVASMAMVLNASRITAPTVPEFKGYPLFTQDNVFNERTDRVVRVETVLRQGLTLEQLSQLLAAHGLKTKAIHAGEVGPEQFRALAVKNLTEPDNFVVVNYLRKAIGQQSGGHISPLAAYHAASDSFLILDVSRYKYPPVWVDAELLWKAMNTIDQTSGKTRGLVLIDQ
ncbi:phytochelatin synthase family protein [Methylomonas sp. MgM2]